MRFVNDYSELAHPEVLRALSRPGVEPLGNYGLDAHSIRAASLIRDRIGRPDAEVRFCAGGTQANLLVLTAALRPHEAVIACGSGHIATHETGAIEATGHKVYTVDGDDGKLTPEAIGAAASYHSDEHMVKPRLAYLSHSTENGTIYSRSELEAIREACDRFGLYLYVDGARLGSALNAGSADVGYRELGALADAFYIGGTKNGALFGEAIVLCAEPLRRDFRYIIKQRGAMLAKGAAIGLQFEALFEDGLYDRIARSANATAARLAEGIRGQGYRFRYAVQSNQIFPILRAGVARELGAKYGFHTWEELGEDCAVRLVTSWATDEAAVDEFLTDLRAAGGAA